MKTIEELEKELASSMNELVCVSIPTISLEDIQQRTAIYYKRCQVNHLLIVMLKNIYLIEDQIRLLQLNKE